MITTHEHGAELGFLCLIQFAEHGRLWKYQLAWLVWCQQSPMVCWSIIKVKSHVLITTFQEACVDKVFVASGMIRVHYTLILANVP